MSEATKEKRLEYWVMDNYVYLEKPLGWTAYRVKRWLMKPYTTRNWVIWFVIVGQAIVVGLGFWNHVSLR